MNSEFPFWDGLRTFLLAILGHMESVIVSTMMAWFIMHNQSQFLFLHDYAYAPFDLLLKRSVPSRIINVNQSTYFLNRVDDYLYCPQVLEQMNWYNFVAKYNVVHLLAKNQNELMHFSSQ